MPLFEELHSRVASFHSFTFSHSFVVSPPWTWPPLQPTFHHNHENVATPLFHLHSCELRFTNTHSTCMKKNLGFAFIYGFVDWSFWFYQSLRALLQGRNVLLSFEACKSSVRSDKSAVGKEDQDIEVVVYILESWLQTDVEFFTTMLQQKEN